MYQASTGPLFRVVITVPDSEQREEFVTVDGAAATRPGEVWGHAADAFERWTAGEEVALDELVRVMTPVLWHVVRAHRLPADLAEDVVQTTWLSLVRSRDSIQDATAVGGWLTTTARRESWRVARATGRALPVEDDELARRVPDEESTEATVVRRHDENRLWSAVDALSERCQRLLRIVAFENRPDYARIAQDLSMPVGSIGPTRMRCLEKLRAELATESNESTESTESADSAESKDGES